MGCHSTKRNIEPTGRCNSADEGSTNACTDDNL
jgi:hypothetical protein